MRRMWADMRLDNTKKLKQRRTRGRRTRAKNIEHKIK